MNKITLKRPDDFHLHLRDGNELASIVTDSARQFARAIVMPNLKPPVTRVEQALAYRQRILDCLGPDMDFQPLMTLFLTDNMSVEEVRCVTENDLVQAIKYYPAGATTNADLGVTVIDKIFPVLEVMTELNIPLLVHGEVTDPEIDVFDREKVFIEQVLSPLINRFNGLRIVFEHITTAEAVEFVTHGPATLAATITPHHLLYNRNALFNQGLRPHNYCLPLLKRERHRQALLEAIAGGHPRFFLGTDSAPHGRLAKESNCGCAGIYSAKSAIELYAEIFETIDCLDKLEKFASINGADFYGLPRNTGTITLLKSEWMIPDQIPFGDSEIIPLKAGEVCSWKLIRE